MSQFATHCASAGTSTTTQKTTSHPSAELKTLADQYNQMVVDEQKLAPDQRVVANVGKMNAKKHLEAEVHKLMSSNITQCMGTMLDTVVF